MVPVTRAYRRKRPPSPDVSSAITAIPYQMPKKTHCLEALFLIDQSYLKSCPNQATRIQAVWHQGQMALRLHHDAACHPLATIADTLKQTRRDQLGFRQADTFAKAHLLAHPQRHKHKHKMAHE